MYVETGGGQKGPFESSEILEQIGRGELSPHDQVWIEGTTSTIPASDLLPVSAFGTDGLQNSNQGTPPVRFREPFAHGVALKGMPRRSNGISAALFCVGGFFIFVVFGAIFLYCSFFILIGLRMSAARNARLEFEEFNQLKSGIIEYVEEHPAAGLQLGEIVWAMWWH